MVTIAICDDETRILEDIKEQIEKILYCKGIQAQFILYESCEEVLNQYAQIQPDFLFLDIDMPGMNGFELAKRLTAMDMKGLLVFVTNQDALVYESFSFHPFAFIRKAYFEREIEDVLNRMLTENNKVSEYYAFQIANETIKLPLQSMLYFEADGNYVRLITTHEEYRIRETLGNLSDKLEKAGFIRIHKGFLVNQAFILAIKYDEIELTNHMFLPIGRTNRDSIRQKVMKYLR